MSVYVGVMSGTSLDGLDVAVVDFGGDEEHPSSMEVLGFLSRPYDPGLRDRIRDIIDAGRTSDVCKFDFEFGRLIGEAVNDALVESDVSGGKVRAVGSHGQTIWHEPPDGGRPGSTLQVGNGAVIAELVGVDVISDFRTRDMAAGGQGAPLTAYVDWLLFSAAEPRLIQNIGGMANVTVLPPLGSDRTPIAFDTGPGVALIDGAAKELAGQPFDEDGRLAAAGQVDEAALQGWLADPYFDRPPPKSTGREHFSTSRLRTWLERHAGLAVEDALATLTELTARSIARGYELADASTAACYLCGGGARNPSLVGRLRDLVAPRPVHDLSDLGVDPDAREAIGFALLARQHDLGIPANAPWATGASGRRTLGSRTPA